MQLSPTATGSKFSGGARSTAFDALPNASLLAAGQISTTLSRQLETLVGFQAPPILVKAFHCALQLELDKWNCSALAASLNMHERTLRKLFFNEELPSPQWLLGWTKLLLSACLLSDLSLTIDDIANRLDYSTPSAYRRAIKRYVIRPANALRIPDAPAIVANHMRQAFTIGSADSRHPAEDFEPQ